MNGTLQHTPVAAQRGSLAVDRRVQKCAPTAQRRSTRVRAAEVDAVEEQKQELSKMLNR